MLWYTMRNSTQTWGLSTDPDVLLTVPKNSFQTIPERYNQPPVSLILPKVYYAWSRRSNAFDKSRRTTKAIFLRGLDIEKKMVENMINPTRNTDVMPGKWIQLSGVWVKKKSQASTYDICFTLSPEEILYEMLLKNHDHTNQKLKH